MVTINAEEDLTVLRSPAIPYIDVQNDITPNAFHAFEVVQANYIAEGTVLGKPKMSANSTMVGRIMLNNGYQLHSGLGKNLQGRLSPIHLVNKKNTYGLGYKPTMTDRKKMFEQIRQDKIARLEGIIPISAGLGEIPPLSTTFPKVARIKSSVRPLVIKLESTQDPEIAKELPKQKETVLEHGETSEHAPAIDEVPP